VACLGITPDAVNSAAENALLTRRQRKSPAEAGLLALRH
jgi:hypothetical protein